MTPRLAALVRKDADPAGRAARRGRRRLPLPPPPHPRRGLRRAARRPTRAELHERFASWLEQHGGDLVELDEILGYHLEQAWRYRRPSSATSGEHRRTARHGGASAPGAVREAGPTTGRTTPPALNLLERAAALRDDAPLDAALRGRPDLGAIQQPVRSRSACSRRSRRPPSARRGQATNLAALALRLDHARLRARSSDRPRRRRPSASRSSSRRHSRSSSRPATTGARRSPTWAVLSCSDAQSGSQAEIAATCEPHARARPPRRTRASSSTGRRITSGPPSCNGTTPVEECLRWLDANPELERRSVLPRRDGLLAQLGRFEEAHELLAASADARRGARIGVGVDRARPFGSSTWRCSRGRRPLPRRPLARHTSATTRPPTSRSLMRAVLRSRPRPARARTRRRGRRVGGARSRAVAEHRASLRRCLSRQVEARVLARRGEHVEAERLAREAVALGDETDMLNAQGDAYADLAEVLRLARQDPTRRGLRSARRSRATSARATSSWRHGRARQHSPRSRRASSASSARR